MATLVQIEVIHQNVNRTQKQRSIPFAICACTHASAPAESQRHWKTGLKKRGLGSVCPEYRFVNEFDCLDHLTSTEMRTQQGSERLAGEIGHNKHLHDLMTDALPLGIEKLRNMR